MGRPGSAGGVRSSSGQAERQGLARAGLGLAADVPPGQGVGDGERLDREGMGDARRVQRLDQVGGKAEGLECGPHVIGSRVSGARHSSEFRPAPRQRPTPAMHARPPDTTENWAVVSGGDDTGFEVAETGPAGDDRDVDRVQTATEAVGHLELQDRAPEHRRDHVGGAGDGEEQQPEPAATPSTRTRRSRHPTRSRRYSTARPGTADAADPARRDGADERARRGRGVQQPDRPRAAAVELGAELREQRAGMPNTMALMSIRNVPCTARCPRR